MPASPSNSFLQGEQTKCTAQNTSWQCIWLCNMKQSTYQNTHVFTVNFTGQIKLCFTDPPSTSINNYVPVCCDVCDRCVFKNGHITHTLVTPFVSLSFIGKCVIQLSTAKISNITAIQKSYFGKNFIFSSVSTKKLMNNNLYKIVLTQFLHILKTHKFKNTCRPTVLMKKSVVEKLNFMFW